MSYHRLTLEQRYQIEGFLKTEMSARSMARALNVAPSTVVRELKRNSSNYCAKKAHKAYCRRRRDIGPPMKIVGDLQQFVDEDLRRKFSPDVISHFHKVSHETIYRYVYKDKQNGGELYKNLRRGRKWRTSRSKLLNQSNCHSRPDRVNISQRPEIVNKRCRVGDYERDLMLGKSGRILTIVDRASRLVKIAKVPKQLSANTHLQTVRLLKDMKVHTITNDNGHEFSLHRETAEILNAKVYFADPYCSWQRGTNENTNGLIRQYLKDGTDFNEVSDEYVQWVEDQLNNRPRKGLGYKTPFEVHRELSQGVALSS